MPHSSHSSHAVPPASTAGPAGPAAGAIPLPFPVPLDVVAAAVLLAVPAAAALALAAVGPRLLAFVRMRAAGRRLNDSDESAPLLGGGNTTGTTDTTGITDSRSPRTPYATSGSALSLPAPDGCRASDGFTATSSVWPLGCSLSRLSALLVLALAAVAAIQALQATAGLAAAALALQSLVWTAVAFFFLMAAPTINTVANTPDALPPSAAPHVAAVLLVNIFAQVYAIYTSDSPSPATAFPGTLLTFSAASAVLSVVVLAIEWARSVQIAARSTDEHQELLAARTDATGAKIPVPSLENNAPIWSRILFSWVSPLLRKSSRAYLEHDDVWDLSDSEKAELLLAKFNTGSNVKRSLFWRLLVLIFPGFFAATAFCAIGAVLVFSGPFFLNRIVNFVEHADEPQYFGFIYAFGLFFSSIVKAWCDGQYFHTSRRVGIRLRSVLISEIYRKSLRRCLNATTASDDKNKKKDAKKDDADKKDGKDAEKKDDADKNTDDEASLGKVVTLMSVDTRRLRDILSYLSWIFITPVQIVACVLALFSLLGWSALAGVAVMVIVIPLVSLVSKLQYKMSDRYLSKMDKRVTVVNEMLQGIRIVKFFGWEQEFSNKVNKAREGELSSLIGVFCGKALGSFVWDSIPLLVSFVTFFAFTKFSGRDLDATTAFTSLSLFSTLRFPLMVFPEILMDAVQAAVSLRRIEAFLAQPELEKLQEDKAHLFESDWREVQTRPGFRHASYTWSQDAPDLAAAAASAASAAEPQPQSQHHHFVLSNVHLTFPVGGLTAVVGLTGSGKSSLAQALLGEMKTLGGRTVFPAVLPASANRLGQLDTSVAYVAQTAWLQNATVRDNILFGLPFDEQRYNSVISACALVRDLETFPAGDQTEIGEKGINMSGGQKQRISLARAAYSRAKFVILDDPLSAVDAPTALHLFEKCIRGLLADRTVILVTHATGLVLPSADYVVYVAEGTVTAHGTVADLKESADLSAAAETDQFAEHLRQALLGEKVDEVAPAGVTSSKNAAVDEDAAPKVSGDGKLVEEETKQTGSVKLAIYKRYLAAVGGIPFLVVFIVFCFTDRFVQVADDWWLKVWADAYKTVAEPTNITAFFFADMSSALNKASTQSLAMILPSAAASSDSLSTMMSATSTTNGPSGHTVDFYLWVYGALGLGVILHGQILLVLYAIGSYRASKQLHASLLNRVLNAPMRFFDKTPIGRILNRFSKDIESIDAEVGEASREFIAVSFRAFCVLVVVTSISPLFPLAFIPLVIVFTRIAASYLKASRELRRLEAVSQSPLYAKFSETLQGAATIRAFGQEQRFVEENFRLINKNHRAHFFLWAANRWLGIRSELAAACMVLVASTSLVLARSVVNAGLAGLCLAYALELVFGIIWMIRTHAWMEMSMNAVERVDEYLQIEQEDAAIVDDYRPSPQWPATGAIEFKNLSVRYSPDLPRVLNDLSFSIGAFEKVGIVGRTGAGKSTLSLAMFRIVPHDAGSIVIDGMDIGRMGLWDLRSRLTIIPQDPVLFSGTVRTNLDPFGKHHDDALWAALKRVHFLESLQSRPVAGSEDSKAKHGRTLPSGDTLVAIDADISSSDDDAIDVSDDAPLLDRQASTATAIDSNATAVHVSSARVDGPKSAMAVSKGFDLSAPVLENGSNFSQGQRQLLCLARALLQASRVIILDEATASVDHSTDAKIQSTIRTEFSNATVLTIAHRLSTVADYDSILVLDGGRVAQYGSPHALLADKDGLFYQMCAESGELELLLSMAADAHDARAAH
ncbi:hypothetical protein BC831DRAFT_482842 [Entophlyctis helioformis]|nr:hypothetical protein BC831DRAFT_482842 [Entophlyctis helioformis]